MTNRRSHVNPDIAKPSTVPDGRSDAVGSRRQMLGSRPTLSFCRGRRCDGLPRTIAAAAVLVFSNIRQRRRFPRVGAQAEGPTRLDGLAAPGYGNGGTATTVHVCLRNKKKTGREYRECKGAEIDAQVNVAC